MITDIRRLFADWLEAQASRIRRGVHAQRHRALTDLPDEAWPRMERTISWRQGDVALAMSDLYDRLSARLRPKALP